MSIFGLPLIMYKVPVVSDDMGDLEFIEGKVLTGDYFQVSGDIDNINDKIEFIVPNIRTAFLIEAKITMTTNPEASSITEGTTSTNDQIVASLQKNINTVVTEFSKAKIGVASRASGSQAGRAGSGSGFGTNADSRFNVLGFSLIGDGILNKIEIENVLNNGSAFAEMSGYLV